MKLSDTDIAVLFQHASRRRFAAASVIIREGAKPESLYWLVEGRAAVRLPNWRGQDVTLGYFETGDFFGEMGLLPSPGERTARVQAVTDCAVLEIGYGPFRKLASTHDQLWLTLLGQVAERLRHHAVHEAVRVSKSRYIGGGTNLAVPERLLTQGVVMPASSLRVCARRPSHSS